MLQPGNTLVPWTLDRLGRDLRHLVTTAEELRARGVGLKVLTGAGTQINTTTTNGRLAFGILAAVAEFERADRRTHQRGPGRRPRPGPLGRQAPQDGQGNAHHGHGRYARSQGERSRA